jgi:hypothetical protein
MLAIVFILFGAMLSEQMIRLSESYQDQISFYRSEYRNEVLSTNFLAARTKANQLGVWPEDQEQLARLVELSIGPASNFILDNDELNVHRELIHYARSAEVGSLYESDRAALISTTRETDFEDTVLSGDNNGCSSVSDHNFNSGEPWCPPTIQPEDTEILRDSTQAMIAQNVALQEAKIRFLTHKVANYATANEALPSTPGGLDVPLSQHVVTGGGGGFNASTEECDPLETYTWDGIPIDCHEMFTVWHVDSLGPSINTELADIFDVNVDRLFSPVRIYRDGNQITVYTETPFERYSSGAWSARTEKRGEDRPNSGAFSYIYTTVTY